MQLKACTICVQDREATLTWAPGTLPPAPCCRSSQEAWPRRDLTNTRLLPETTSPGAGNISEPNAKHSQEEEAHLDMAVMFCSRLEFVTHVATNDLGASTWKQPRHSSEVQFQSRCTFQQSLDSLRWKRRNRWASSQSYTAAAAAKRQKHKPCEHNHQTAGVGFTPV